MHAENQNRLAYEILINRRACMYCRPLSRVRLLCRTVREVDGSCELIGC